MRKLFDFGGGEEKSNKPSVNRSGERGSPDLSFYKGGDEEKTKDYPKTTKKGGSNYKGITSLASLVCYHHRRGKSFAEVATLSGVSEEDVRAIVTEAKSSDVYDALADELES